jgi:hypothetical protein
LLIQKVTTDGADEDPELALDGSPVAILTCWADTLSAAIRANISNNVARAFVLKRRRTFLLGINVLFKGIIEVNHHYQSANSTNEWVAPTCN